MLYNFPGVGLFAVGLIDEKLRCRTEKAVQSLFSSNPVVSLGQVIAKGRLSDSVD